MEHWKKEFHLCAMRLLDDILKVGSCKNKTVASTAVAAVSCSQLSDDMDSYSYLKLLRQLLYTAIDALTDQQYSVKMVLLDCESDSREPSRTLTLDELLEANNCKSSLGDCESSTQRPHQALLPVASPQIAIDTSSAGLPKRKRGRPRKSSATVPVSELKHFDSSEVINNGSKVADQCSNTEKTAFNLRRSQRKTCTPIKFCKQSYALGRANDGDCSLTELDDKQRNEQSLSSQSLSLVKNYSRLSQYDCLAFKKPACFICDRQFTTMSNCLEHWRDHHFSYSLHKTKAYVVCSQCPVQFAIPASRLSSDLHVEVQIARCLKHAVRMHGVAVPADVVEQFDCPEPRCRFAALTKAAFTKHQRRGRHCTGSSCPAQLVCDRCGKQLKSSALSSHLRVCQQPRDFRHAICCPHCSERLASRYSLRFHVRTVHSDLIGAAREFYCAYCAYASNKRGNFVEHVYRRHGINGSSAAIYSCQLCSYTTVKPSSLRRHCNQTHNYTRNIACPVCSKAFKCQLNLKTHMLVHQDYQERGFPCRLCNYRAARKTNLDAHVNAQHGSNRRQFHCSACGYMTGYTANLRKHQRLFCKYRQQTDGQMDYANATVVNVVGTAVDVQQETEFPQGLASDLTVTVPSKLSVNGAVNYTDCYSFGAE